MKHPESYAELVEKGTQTTLYRHQPTFGSFIIRPLYETLHEIRPSRTETTMDAETLLELCDQCT